jgi:hypothetical protein
MESERRPSPAAGFVEQSGFAAVLGVSICLAAFAEFLMRRM